MKVYFGTDHAGFEMKNGLLDFVRELPPHEEEGPYEVEDMGAYEFDEDDDYPEFVACVARAVSGDPFARGVVLGASGQGEAMVANRFRGVRAAVYYGERGQKQKDANGKEIDMISSTRMHNDANVLSLGARFISVDEAKEAVRAWLSTSFSGDERHARRIKQIENVVHE